MPLSSSDFNTAIATLKRYILLNLITQYYGYSKFIIIIHDYYAVLIIAFPTHKKTQTSVKTIIKN